LPDGLGQLRVLGKVAGLDVVAGDVRVDRLGADRPVGQQRRLVDRVVPGGVGRGPLKRARDSSFCVAFLVTRSRCASTIAASAAVMSSAEVISKANTYLVNSCRASERMLPPCPVAAARPASGANTRLPMASTISVTKPSPAIAAQNRCPRIVSTSESELSTPTSMSVNRNSIMTAPV
jgi:hypothetical protein